MPAPRVTPIALVAFVTLAAAAVSGGASAGMRPAASPASKGSYTGPGSCAASSCHGSVRPVPGSRILQTEYTTWILQDKHAKAAEVLSDALSVRIAKILGLPRADTAPRCLACHALDVPESEQGRSYEAEGVSCEACHGPASGWLGPHTTRGWTYAQSLAAGMYDTRNLVKRAELCASCHIGTAGKSVDHEMIAAGHPDLVFDLAAFSAAMPRHWQAPADDPWHTIRTWRTGQIVQLREGLARLARRAKGPVWPEYSEFDCFSCHHSLTRPEDSWRQALGYANRRPGNPPWNHSRVAVARIVARFLDPEAAARLDAGLATLSAEVSKLQPDRARIATLATGLEPTLDTLASRAAAATADRESTVRMVRAIAGDADRISNEGERSAEQAAMSLETLLDVYVQNVKGADGAAVRKSLDALFQQLENPSAYDPRRFAPQLQRMADLVGGRRSPSAGHGRQHEGHTSKR
ncbi:MAG TPA: multiheme c-type cytochrome [Vicinamibacterales bacterium]|nr:multiheme c-type cytochrome [Vicinamibacterales bacterium]